MAADPGARSAATLGSASSLHPAPGSGVLVVGYGNPLRSDDGVGPVVAERIATDARFGGVEVRTQHQLTPELAFDASRARLLVLVDADDRVAPGGVVVRELSAPGVSGSEGEDEAAEPGVGEAGRIEEGGPPLTHHVDPASLLGLSAALWGSAPRTLLVGIGPASFELGERLTPIVEAAVPVAIERIAELAAALLAIDGTATHMGDGPEPAPAGGAGEG